MKEEIKKIIEKHMPEQVGDVLKQQLQELEDLKAAHKSLEYSSNLMSERNEELTEANAELLTQIGAHQAIDVRESEVSELERNQKVFEAKLKASESERRAMEMHGFVQMVFSSPVYRQRKSFQPSGMINHIPGHTDVNGNWINERSVPAKDEEITETKIE